MPELSNYQLTQTQTRHVLKTCCLLTVLIFLLTSCSDKSTSSPNPPNANQSFYNDSPDPVVDPIAPTNGRQDTESDTPISLQECMEDKVIRNRNVQCQDDLVYAEKSAPKDIRDEIERLGATVDAIQAVRMSEYERQQDECPKVDGYIPASCILERIESGSSATIAELEDRESAAWIQLYYFAKEYREHVQPQQYSRILIWGGAILKCQPTCEYNYE